MKNKKIVIAVIIIAIIATFGIAAYLYMTKEEPIPVQLDLATVNTKISSEGGFDEMRMVEVDEDTLKTTFGIDETAVSEFVGKVPLVNITSSMYVILKAKDGQVDAVKQKLEAYGTSYEKEWESYLPEQYNLVKQRQIGNIGNYVYCIVADNAKELVELIK